MKCDKEVEATADDNLSERRRKLLRKIDPNSGNYQFILQIFNILQLDNWNNYCLIYTIGGSQYDTKRNKYFNL